MKNMTIDPNIIEWSLYNEPGNKIIARIGIDQNLNEVAWDYNCDRQDCHCVGGWVEGDESKVVEWIEKNDC